MAPKAFGYPLWYGKIKKRIAKKKINKYRKQFYMGKLYTPFMRLCGFSNYGPGSLINDCSGLNIEIKTVDPEYRFTKKGAWLSDFDIQGTPHGSCSFFHCGVDHPITQEQAEKVRQEMVKVWTGSEWKFSENYSEDNMKILPDGTYRRKDWNEW